MDPLHGGRLFRRQFMLSDEPSELAPSGFEHAELADGHLYHCPSLPVAHLVDADHTRWTLLGEAFPGPDSRDLEEAMRSCSTGAVPDAYRSWDGRWVLIGNGEVHTDLRGSIPVFYTYHSLASTPGILRPGERPLHQLTKSERCDWFPAPGTGFQGVSRVLPSQVLTLGDRSCLARALPTPAQLSPGDVIGTMRDLLRTTIQTLDCDRIVVPVTAGWDSRLVLSACVDAGVEALCVTLTYPQISKADWGLPPLLAKAVGYEHRRVGPGPRGERSPEAGDMYDAQVGGHIREMDRRFFERGQYDWVRPGDAILRGLSLDTLRRRHHVWPPDGVEDADSLVRWLQPSAVQEAGLRRYLAWIQEDPQPLPFGFRYSLEQGESAWASLSEVALDLTPGRSLNPGNSWLFADTVLSLPLEARARSEHHRVVIEQNAPRLLDHPVNPAESRWRPRRLAAALQRRAVRWTRRVRQG